MSLTKEKQAAAAALNDSDSYAGTDHEGRQRSNYAPSIIAASSVAGSVAARSRITKMTAATAVTMATTVSEKYGNVGGGSKGLRGQFESLGTYLWDGQTKRVCNRSPTQFVFVLLAYAVYYSITIAVMAIGWFFVSYLVIDEDIPELTGTHNALQLQPTLSMRPTADYMGTLVYYKQSRPESYLMHTNNIQAYLDQYELFYNTERDVNIVDCDYEANTKASDDPMDPCRFRLEWLQTCNKQSFFGYPRGTPCVLVKLNRVYGWVPDIEQPELSHNILFKCQGRFDADRDNIGQLRYFPSSEVNGTTYGVLSPLFYPYLTQVGFRSPMSAVQFLNPKRNVVIMIECQLYNVANVKIDKTYNAGYLSFELMID